MLDLNYQEINLDYDTWKSFDIDNIKEDHFALTINRNGVKYEFVMKRNKASDKVLFLGSGANPHALTPTFNRISWIDDFDYNMVYYNDPTVYLDDLKVGWGYGSKDRHYLSEIGDILKIYLDKINIKNKDAYFFGSSGGGFNSIMLATLFKDSTAIAYNPQTSLVRYFKTVIEQLFNAVYGENYDEEINNNMWRISLSDFMAKNNNTPKLFYVINLGCKFDVESHLMPFIKEVSEMGYSENIQIIGFYNKELGHSIFSKLQTIDLIKSIVERKQVYIQ